MQNIDVVQLIVEYVGPQQYRFVATINRSFHEAYSKVFLYDSKTGLIASTVELAKYCLEDLVGTSTYCCDYVNYFQCMLCTSAARYGNLQVLQYLRSVGCADRKSVV